MKYSHFIGIDEVGRGPVAGPVYVCAVILEPKNINKIVNTSPAPLRDSKKLTEKMRIKWLDHLKTCADGGLLRYAISSAKAEEIDDKGISVCIKACVDSCVRKLNPEKDSKVFLDGGLVTSLDFDQEALIKGDEEVPVISLASIIAKVLRDEEMKELGKKYPEYKLEKHKGYGTKDHMDSIKKHGLTELHRKSFLKKYI